MKPKILTISTQHKASKDFIQSLLALLQKKQKHVLFVRQAEHLDIDTPNKDSYELFEAGLDFAMLVTDKQRYLKSRHDVTQYLPIPPQTDWVIQDGAVYPHDIHLTISKNDTIITDDGKSFPLEPLTPLIHWLEQYEHQ